MDNITIDFETYYDKDYSLGKMKPILYIRDPRFLCHGMAVQINKEEPFWVHPEDVQRAFNDFNPAKTNMVGHNLLFDAAIATEHYNFRPASYFDTWYAAQALIPHIKSRALKVLGPLLNCGEKLDGLDDTKGLRELPEDIRKALEIYGVQDARITANLFYLFEAVLPEKEKRLMSMTTRMGTDAILQLDYDQLEVYYNGLIEARDAAIKRCGTDAKVLASNQQYAELLTTLGLEVPTKLSPATGKTTWALGKADRDYVSLQAQHPEWADVFKARELVKSTGPVTRAKVFMDIATTGPLPMPLMYCGAHTTRWSGSGGINPQNLKRGSPLRKAIKAPDGYVIVVGDLSQIELRMNAWFAGQTDLLEVLRNGDDPYRYTASKVLGIPYDSIDKGSMERQLGKILALGLGYGMGAAKLQEQMAIGMLGLDPIHVSLSEAYDFVNGYRRTNDAIAAMWAMLDAAIASMYHGIDCDFKAIDIIKDGFRLPSGLDVVYDQLEPSEEGWVHARGRLWGSIVDENVIQALSRCVVSDHMLEADEHPLLHVVSSTHDEIIALAPAAQQEEACAELTRIMKTNPAWCPDLPLDCEVGADIFYTK